jgi:hypothetical protein
MLASRKSPLCAGFFADRINDALKRISLESDTRLCSGSLAKHF